MSVITYADAPTVGIEGITARPMAVPSRGSAELAIWYLRIDPGARGETHIVHREEVFLVQEGEFVAILDGERHALTVGDAFLVPPGVPFGLENVGSTPATLLVCTSVGITATLNGQVVRPPWAQ